MNTRKSSPLPNPNDTLKQYRINYEVHYQNLHKYLMGRVEKEKQARNQLIKQFNRYAKTINKLQQNSSDDNEQNQLQLKQAKHKMQKVYSQICSRQLQIHKLLQEDQGVIMQLCALLNNKGNEIKNYRESSIKNYTVTFLHHVSNVINAFQDFDHTLSIDNQDLQKSQQNSDSMSKSQQIHPDLHQPQGPPVQQTAQQIECNKEIETQQTVFNPNKQKNQFNQKQQTAQKFRQSQKINQNFNQLKILNQPKNENNQFPQKQKSFKEKISSIINQYKKSDQLTNDLPNKTIVHNNCIELNSSTDDIMIQNNSSKGHVIKGHIYSDDSKKNRLKRKKLLKSCITILD